MEPQEKTEQVEVIFGISSENQEFLPLKKLQYLNKSRVLCLQKNVEVNQYQ